MLIISDVNEAGLSELADLLKQRGRLLLSRCVDVSDRAQMQAFAEGVPLIQEQLADQPDYPHLPYLQADAADLAQQFKQHKS